MVRLFISKISALWCYHVLALYSAQHIAMSHPINNHSHCSSFLEFSLSYLLLP